MSVPDFQTMMLPFLRFAQDQLEKRARKGVFITTSNFTKEAREYVALIDSKIILIDGEELA